MIYCVVFIPLFPQDFEDAGCWRKEKQKKKKTMNCTYEGNNQRHLSFLSSTQIDHIYYIGTSSTTCGWDNCLFVSIYVCIFWYLALSLCLRLIKFLPVKGIICSKRAKFQYLFQNKFMPSICCWFFSPHQFWLQIWHVYLHYTLIWDNGTSAASLWCIARCQNSFFYDIMVIIIKLPL